MPDALATTYPAAPILAHHGGRSRARPTIGTTTRARTLTVIIVDDDDISRHGMAALLTKTSEIDVLAAVSHTYAGSGAIDWRDADMVLVDAADERRTPDQFPGVAIVEQIRRRSPARDTTVMVFTEHFFDDALRCRMREAGADFFWDRGQLREARTLVAAVLDPRQPPGVPDELDPESLFRLGITGATRVNRAVDFAVRHGLIPAIAARTDPRSRQWLRLRRDFNREARLNPVTTDGRVPERARDTPSLPQIARFLTWATRIKTHHPHPVPPAAVPLVGSVPHREY